MTEEQWLPLEGHPHLFVSDHGRVKSEAYIMETAQGPRKVEEKIRALTKTDYDDKMTVTTRTNGKYQCHSVHRLVAQAFIPNPDNLPNVVHIDGNKTNNHVSNLKWVTRERKNHISQMILLKHSKNSRSWNDSR